METSAKGCQTKMYIHNSLTNLADEIEIMNTVRPKGSSYVHAVVTVGALERKLKWKTKRSRINSMFTNQSETSNEDFNSSCPKNYFKIPSIWDQSGICSSIRLEMRAIQRKTVQMTSFWKETIWIWWHLLPCMFQGPNFCKKIRGVIYHKMH